MGYKRANEHGRTSGSSKDCSSEIIGRLFSSSLKVANFGTVEPARALLLLKLAGMVGHKPASRRCFGIAFVSKRPPAMMDRAAFFVCWSIERRSCTTVGSATRGGAVEDMEEAYFVRWIVTQPFLQIVRTCLSRWAL
ncbi:hypothetical protein ABIE78_001087 [Sinorhizobium fredii]